MEADCELCGGLALLDADRWCVDCLDLIVERGGPYPTAKEASRKSYLAHRPARLAYQREYYLLNKPKALAYAQEYLQGHKPEINAGARKRYARNHGIDFVNPETDNN